MNRISHPHPPGRKITFLITDLRVGGVPLHLLRLATGLAGRGWRPEVICLADDGPVGSRLREAGVPVQACGARQPTDLFALWRLWRALIARPPALLHAMLFHANLAARVVGPLSGIGVSRILCEIQTVEVERHWHLWMDGLTHRLCRLEIGNSPSVVEHLGLQARIPRRRLLCMWGAVDVSRFARAEPLDRASLAVGPAEPLLVWTGRLDPIKGFEEMLAGFSRAVGSGPGRLLLVGEGPYRPAVERLIGELGLGGRVELLGRRDDVPGLLRSADLFLFCSRTEGLPNSLLEAMAAGLPIVATDVPGCRDLIRHGRTGWLARSGDAASIAAGIRGVLGDPALATRLGRAAREWVGVQADQAGWLDRWEALYHAILGRSSRSSALIAASGV